MFGFPYSGFRIWVLAPLVKITATLAPMTSGFFSGLFGHGIYERRSKKFRHKRESSDISACKNLVSEVDTSD